MKLTKSDWNSFKRQLKKARLKPTKLMNFTPSKGQSYFRVPNKSASGTS